MLVNNIKIKSKLYQTLEALGLLCTEDYYVRTSRKALHDLHTETYYTSNADILGVGYLNSHITIHLCERTNYSRDSVELWINGEPVVMSKCEWIGTENNTYDYILLPDWYEDGTEVTVRYYDGVFEHYSVRALSDGAYTHRRTIDFTEYPASLVANPMCCLFYYADGELVVPDADDITDNGDGTFTYRLRYTRTLEAYWCYNMVSAHRVKANEPFYLHSPELKRTYPMIYVDREDDYKIDTLFYPLVRVDKDCIVRVFSDNAQEMPCPEASRLVLYPEFLEVDNMYESDDPRLTRLTGCDALITDTDSDSDILEKFREIAPYCYRVYDHFPKFSDEQSDFLALDNRNWDDCRVVPATIHALDGTDREVLLINAPFQPHRDILFYDGWICSSYDVVTLDNLTDLNEKDGGTPYYVFTDTSLNPDLFTLLKFNTNEDTNIVNIGDWINKDNLVNLHHKLNRFYRNLLVLRGSVQDGIDGEEKVRIATAPPTVTDDERLWFELLVNAETEDFGVRPIESIEIAGLDPTNIPTAIEKAIFDIDLEPDEGPSSYKDMVITYFKLTDDLKDSLVLQSVKNEDTDYREYDHIDIGPLPENAEPNDIVIESDTPEPPLNQYYTGDGDPDTETWDTNDTYLNIADISYMDDAGVILPPEYVNNLTREQKIKLIDSYITTGTDAEIEEVKTLWNSYLDDMNDDNLNRVTYKVLTTAYYYKELTGTGINLDENVPKDRAVVNNVKLIVGKKQPTHADVAALWIDTSVVPVEEYLTNIICAPFIEVASYAMPDGTYDHDSDTGTLAFDYMAHGTEIEGELFREVIDDSLHPVSYGQKPADPAQNDVWYEFLEDIHGRICYADSLSMVLRVDERLVMVEFDNDNVTAFLFDDVLMNFRGRLGIRYLSIVADLMNSGVIDKKDVNVFYHRLITSGDNFDPRLERLYSAGRSHVVSMADVDTTDMSILYSTNIGRFRIDYGSDQIDNNVRDMAWRHVIDYRQMDVGFIPDRMLLFVNGQLIPYDHFVEPAAGMLQLTSFDEVIHCVDILYSQHDVPLSMLKRIAIECWNTEMDQPAQIFPPKDGCHEMVPIVNTRFTKRGYYDILLNEYVLNGRIHRYLHYLKDHPDEFEDFRRELLQHFHMISDVDSSGEDATTSYPRIIIPAIGKHPRYVAGEPR